VTVSTLNPTVGIVVTDCPSFNLYRIAKKILNEVKSCKHKKNENAHLFFLRRQDPALIFSSLYCRIFSIVTFPFLIIYLFATLVLCFFIIYWRARV
jgi:hypothetical protein